MTLERADSSSFQPFFDALAEDVEFITPVGSVRGKQAVIGYFTHGAAKLEFNPFLKPLEYFGEGNRVVQLGDEVFKVKATGATHRADWAWVFDVHDRRITRIRAIMDLSVVAEEIKEALTKAQQTADGRAAA
jgi:ketosteroid isomerase-like protein